MKKIFFTTLLSTLAIVSFSQRTIPSGGTSGQVLSVKADNKNLAWSNLPTPSTPDLFTVLTTGNDAGGLNITTLDFISKSNAKVDLTNSKLVFAGITSLNWNTRTLTDAVNDPSANWNNRSLSNGTSNTLSWGSRNLRAGEWHYDNNYASLYTSRSLIDKGFFDSLSLTADQRDAINFANAPDGSNPFATMNDLSGYAPTLNAVLTAGNSSNIGIQSTNGKSQYVFDGGQTYGLFADGAISSSFIANNTSSVLTFTDGTDGGYYSSDYLTSYLYHTKNISLEAPKYYFITQPPYVNNDTSLYKVLFRNSSTGQLVQRSVVAPTGATGPTGSQGIQGATGPTGANLTAVGATGDLITFSATNTQSNISPVATGSILYSQGTSSIPIWSASPTIGTSITTPLVNISGQTASTIASFDASKNVVSLSTGTYPSLTELSYIKGVTSAIQTQLNARGFVLTGAFTSTVSNPADNTTYYGGSGTAAAQNNIAGIMRIIPLIDCTLTKIIVYYRVGTPGSNETSTVYVRFNNTTDITVSSAVKTDANFQSFSNTGLSQVFNGTTDYFEIKWVTPNPWVTNPTGVVVSFDAYFTPN